MDFIDIWYQGHQLVLDVLGEIHTKEEIEFSKMAELNLIALELKKQLRLIEHRVRGFDADQWEPWRAGENLPIKDAHDLRSKYESFRKYKIEPCYDEIENWEQEVVKYLRELKCIDDGPYPPNTWRQNGVVLSDYRMPSRAFKLVQFLWACKNRTAELHEVSEAVLGADSDGYTMKQLQDGDAKAANRFFRDATLNCSVHTNSKQLTVSLLNRTPK